MTGPSYKWPLIIFILLGALAAAITGNRWAKLQAESSAPVQPLAQPEDIFVSQALPRTVGAPPTASPDSGITLERCQVKMAQAKDPNPPLSIRATPASEAAVVAEIANNNFVDVVNQQSGWFAVKTPTHQGWVPMPLTDYGCHAKLASIQLPPDSQEQAMTVQGRFIGTGVHQYKLALEKGQRLSITGRGGPVLPQLQSPNQRVLFAGSKQADLDVWTGKLPESGEYQLVLSSDNIGYSYAFQVKVR